MQTAPLAARYGGEEFVTILPDTSTVGAITLAERLRELVAGTAFPSAETRPLSRVTICAGVASLDEADADGASLVERATLLSMTRNGLGAVGWA
jgi:diguanylate cyclase (GGDEF)-like protein